MKELIISLTKNFYRHIFIRNQKPLLKWGSVLSAPYLIGIDAGTQGVRAIVFGQDGQLVTGAYKTYPFDYPKPDWVEQTAEDWWIATLYAIREVMAKGKISPKDVAGLSVSSQANTFVPVDKEGKALRPAISWMDQRANAQAKWLSDNLSADIIYQITGSPLSFVFDVPKILWLKENERSIFEKAYKFLQVKDFIIHRLTNVFATDFSLVSLCMFLDIRRKKWAEEILESIGLSPDRLPEVYPSTDIIGEVTEEATNSTGLKNGTPVIVGGHDQCCACVGTGVVSNGLALDSTGTAYAMICPSEKPIIDPNKRLICYCHSVPKYWVVLGQLLSAGILLRWFRDNFCTAEIDEARILMVDPYEVLTKDAEKISVGSDGLIVLPYFAGGRFLNPNARGVIFGLTLNHRRPHITRAIMEAVAYESRYLIEATEELGIQVKELRLAGGAARSRLWRQIKCDVTGRPVLLPRVEEAASLGAAILAGVGVGVYKNVDEAVKKAVVFKEGLEPREDIHEVYNRLYQVYKKLYDDVFESYELLSKAYVE